MRESVQGMLPAFLLLRLIEAKTQGNLLSCNILYYFNNPWFTTLKPILIDLLKTTTKILGISLLNFFSDSTVSRGGTPNSPNPPTSSPSGAVMFIL